MPWRRAITSLSAVVALMVGGVVGASAASAVPSFPDVPDGAPFHAEIGWLAGEGITTGYADGSFRPYDAIKRDAMAAFMYRLAGEPAFSAPSRSPFADVTPSTKFYKEITWLASTGVSTGYADGTFRPRDPVKRDAMAAFMYRLAGAPAFEAPRVSPFKDVPTTAKFYDEITWLAESNVSSGWSDGTYRPHWKIARNAMAAFMYRLNQGVGVGVGQPSGPGPDPTPDPQPSELGYRTPAIDPPHYAPLSMESSGHSVHIDPSVPAGGDGSADAPLNSLQALFDDGEVETRTWKSTSNKVEGGLEVRNEGGLVGPGDTIVLADGDYGTLEIQAMFNEAPITITSAPGARARFDHIAIASSAGWIIDGVEVSGGVPDKGLITVNEGWQGGTAAIEIRNNLVETVSDAREWTKQDWDTVARSGVVLRTDNVTVSGNTIRNVRNGISVWGEHHVIENNIIDGFSGDGLRSIGSDNTRFVGNRISNSKAVNPAHHDDGFQHFPPYDEPNVPTRNVLIKDNIVVNCEGERTEFCGPLQGIVSFDGRIENWTVEGNTVITNHWHGITMSNIHDSVVRNNVMHDPDTLPDVGPAWVRIAADHRDNPSSNVVVECNVAAAVISVAENTDVVLRMNTLSTELGARPPEGC